MEAGLATSMARINEQLKQTAERLRSTDATLARIARLQASWTSREQVEQEGMERGGDSFALHMEATTRALASISGVKAPNQTLSTAAHHDMRPVAPSWCQRKVPDDIPSVTSTKSSRPGLNPKINDVGIQIPAEVVKSISVMAPSAPAAPLLLTDQVVAVGALQVEDNRVAFMPTRCSIHGLCVDAGVQLSAFTREATLGTPAAVVLLNGELQHDIESFSEDDFDGVMTHLGGVPLFLELDLCSAEERFAEKPFKDIACNKDVVDQMLTEVGCVSLFIESDLDTHREHERIADTTIPEEDGKLEQIFSKEGLFGLQPHTETCASQGNFCVINRSRKEAKAMQLTTDHFLNKITSWKSGFSPGDTMEPRQYKCRCLCYLVGSRYYVQYKQWDPCVWNYTDVTELSTTETCDIGGCISRGRNRSDLEFKDSVDNTTLFYHEIGVIVSAYGSAIVKVEHAHNTNCSKSAHMVGHMMWRLTRKFDVLWDGKEDAVGDHVLAGILSWRRNAFSLRNTVQQKIVDLLPHGDSFAWALKLPQKINSAELWEQWDTQIPLRYWWVLLSWCYKQCFLAAAQQLQKGVVHWNQQEGSQCYFHLQYMSEFCIHKLVNASKLDGMSWDPGGVHGSDTHAIACGQAMFCRGGSVTPGIFPGLHVGDGPLTLDRPNTSGLGDGRIKRREVNWIGGTELN